MELINYANPLSPEPPTPFAKPKDIETTTTIGRVEWQAANLHTGLEFAPIRAWVLRLNGRVLLHAISLDDKIEPVSAEDRKFIGKALAHYLTI